ncbi:uncharacterized protein CXorf65 homolog isoform X2 [Sphaerodactylus townsendi]|uniref:uncharacterized protein CXorf65 homolog isoform X2 n=1 Tax=Sphaerodactylus townsendi TaxID=933632 RepID=UPI0020262075|nr:uncharacterized protein CXorf65 homolog isoform X2 [Sphaerodactylus townsendi]
MFIIVLHGENKADIFNSHCKVQILLDCIKSHCGCKEEDEIELADETGQVKNLLLNRHRCAAEFLAERETYVVLSVARGENSSKVDFTPLLQDDSVVNQKFLAKLGSWQDPKAPSPRVKPRKTHHKKASLDIPAMDGLRNHSPLDSRTRTPNASPRQSRKL